MNAVINSKNRIARLALILALATIMAVFGALAESSPAQAATREGTYVNGVSLSSWPSTAKWDNTVTGVRTLTLKGASLSPAAKTEPGIPKSCIYVTANFSQTPLTLNVKLEGTNTITAAKGQYVIYNACPNVTLRIVGTGSLTIKGGCSDGIYSKGPLVIGANVAIQDCASYGIRTEAPITISSGNLSIADNCTNGIQSASNIVANGGTVRIGNGGSYGIYSRGSITTNGGSIIVGTVRKAGIHAEKALSINSSISVNGCQDGVAANQALSVRGGTINVTNPSLRGVTCNAGDINISGGTITVTKFSGAGIQAKGSVNITGGKISATQSGDRTSNYAVAAGDGCKVNNSKAPKCWGTIIGHLDDGATFYKSGSKYKVQTANNTYVTLLKYGGTKTKPTVSKVSFGKNSYNVKTIGAKAFYKNKKIKSVKFGSFVTKINSKAFYGCKKLKTIDFRKVWYPSSLKVGSKAFSKAYKTPTVKVENSAAKTYIKKQLKKRGLKYAKYKVGR